MECFACRHLKAATSGTIHLCNRPGRFFSTTMFERREGSPCGPDKRFFEEAKP